MERAYKQLHDELQEMAVNLTLRPGATSQAVIEQLDQASIDYVPRSSFQEA